MNCHTPPSLRPWTPIRRRFPLASLIAIAIGAIRVALPQEAAAADVDFNREIRPILSEHCFQCHGPDESSREAELRLDLEQAAKRRRGGAFAILPGKPEASQVMARIQSSDPDLVMPPPHTKKPLSQPQIHLIRLWIEQGAGYDAHWSFRGLRSPPVPAPLWPAQVRNPIDRFVQSQLPRHELQPSAEADRAVLLRRVTLDLTGIPPTPAELRNFLQDDRPDAYERVVDRLLASPRYGEHMALAWLEAARYADTSGYQADWERFMWPWRNWVIEAYNRNLHFDQFSIEQLAGDLLPNATGDQILATGFNRNHRINDEGGVIAAEYAVEYVVDRVDTTSTVWLGLTMGCARCHDHKYDPFTQTDFYQMFALFNNVPEKGKDGRRGYADPILQYLRPEVQHEVQQLQAELKATRATLEREQLAILHDSNWLDEQRQRIQSSESPWSVISADAITSEQGVEFVAQPDGSVLATGERPDQVDFVVRVLPQPTPASTHSALTAIRIEALPDPRLTQGGLSYANGNFVLSEVVAKVRSAQRTRPVKLARASADHAQANYPINQAIDGKLATGWAVEGHLRKETRTAVFELAEPLRLAQDEQLEVTLQHRSRFAQHYIGRLRVSVTRQFPAPNATSEPLDQSLREALAADVPSAAQKARLAEWAAGTHPRLQSYRRKLQQLERTLAERKQAAAVPVMVMSEMPEPRTTFVLQRGQYDAPDTQRPVRPDIPAMFGSLPDKFPRNRLGFAQWLFADENPLTARVAANRSWQRFFGKGLVTTTEDFGSQGAAPSHPGLLDWLASELKRGNWDLKRLQRLIVTSHTYRQSSRISQAQSERDPENTWLARGPRFRLTGSAIRDQALAASGLLVSTQGGPSVKPYQPPGLWAEVSFQDKRRSTDFFVQDQGAKLYRRSLYTFWKRSVAPPQMVTFDAAGREMCTVRTSITSTPLQALTLLNDVQFVEAARHLAAAMLKTSAQPRQQLAWGFRALGIEPQPVQIDMLEAAYQKYTRHFQQHQQAALELLQVGESPADAGNPPHQWAAMTAVASVLLNLDQVITKE